MVSTEQLIDIRRQSLEFWRPKNKAAHKDNRPSLTATTLRARARRRRARRNLKEWTR